MQAGRAVDGSHVEDSLGGKGSRVENFVQQGLPGAFRQKYSIDLLLAGPSVPRPTSRPAASMSGTGAMPEANFMFDEGLCATQTFFIRKDGDFILV